MAAPFADLEARLNTDALAHLANATAEYNGVPIDGIFDAEYVDAFGVVNSSASTFLIAGDVEIAAGAYLVFPTATYKVHEARQDGGMLLLILRKVA